MPALIRFVLRQTNSHQVHFLGHSMGGMILCGTMARVDTTTAKIRSCIAIGSGLFLEGGLVLDVKVQVVGFRTNLRDQEPKTFLT